jgi:hypothetical protein
MNGAYLSISAPHRKKYQYVFHGGLTAAFMPQIEHIQHPLYMQQCFLDGAIRARHINHSV